MIAGLGLFAMAVVVKGLRSLSCLGTGDRVMAVEVVVVMD